MIAKFGYCLETERDGVQNFIILLKTFVNGPFAIFRLLLNKCEVFFI